MQHQRMHYVRYKNDRSIYLKMNYCLLFANAIIAATLLESMDLTADPCNDFYQFTCGGWLKKHGIPESYSRWSQFDVLRDQVQNELRGNNSLKC